MLRMTKVSKTFNRGTALAIKAVDDMSLQVPPGQWVSVVGPNGSGKSTCLSLITGECPGDAGAIEVDGQDVTRWPLPRRSRLVARVFQDPSMGTAGSLTVEENLAIASMTGRLSLRPGLSRRRRETFRHRLAELGLGLENRLSEQVGALSGGQRQALAVLMPTLKDPPPRLLLLDEHISSLDPEVAGTVMAITERLISVEEMTTIMVTHNIRNALRYGNRLLMFHRGRIVLDIQGEERGHATVDEILAKFKDASHGEEDVSDEGLL